MQFNKSLRHSRINFVVATLLMVALIIGVTYFYTPITWGTVFDGELSRDKTTASFTVDLALDEEWNVVTGTTIQGTKCNITLLGSPIRVDGKIINSTTLLYRWTEELQSPGTWSGYGFGLKVPWSKYGRFWSFLLQFEGTGKVSITITKFNPWSFITMLLSDVALVAVIVAFGMRYYIDRKKGSRKSQEAV